MAEYIEKEAFIRSIEGNPFTTESVKSYIRVSVKNFPCANVMEVPDTNVVKSNADRIRAMSDEDLAEWISSITPACPPGQDDDCEMYCGGIGCWLDWLKSPVEE